MAKVEYIVSACLAGKCVRYDGGNSKDEKVVQLVNEGRAITVCPEVLGGLKTPRPPCEKQNYECGAFTIKDVNGEDNTEAFVTGAKKTLKIANKYGIKKAILKSLSPSCGYGTIYDGLFTGNKIPGNGVAADLLLNKGFEIYSETTI